MLLPLTKCRGGVGGVFADVFDLRKDGAAMQEITEKFLKEGQSKKGGWNKKQLAVLGISWPPTPGWKQIVIGQLIDEKNAQEFLASKS